MKLFISIFFFLSVNFLTHAKEYSQNFNYTNYQQAVKAANFIRFDMESTKAGMVTTSFTGVVKNYTVTFQTSEDKLIQSAQVEFPALALDTDSDARNEKMHNKCFEHGKYPKIQISFHASLPFETARKIVSGKILIRGKQKPIQIDLSTNIQGNKLQVIGNAKTHLTKLEIPDPSIWIASVRDRVDISFKFDLKL